MCDASQFGCRMLCDLPTKHNPCWGTQQGHKANAYNTYRWEIRQPMIWIRKLLDLSSGNSNRLHDLELIFMPRSFCWYFSFGGFAHSCRIGCGWCRFYFFLGLGRDEVLKVGPKHLHLPNDFVGRSLCMEYVSTIAYFDNVSSERTLIGIPVTWNPWGNRTLFPNNLWYPAANSILVIVKACPKCKDPFM